MEIENNKDKKEENLKKNNSKKISIKKFNDLEGKLLLVNVGTKESPASIEQIKEIEGQIIKLFEDNNINCLAFVTHHAVSMNIINKQN